MIVFLHWIDQCSAPLSMRSGSLVPCYWSSMQTGHTLADRRLLDAQSFLAMPTPLMICAACWSVAAGCPSLVLSAAAAVGQQRQHRWELCSLFAATFCSVSSLALVIWQLFLVVGWPAPEGRRCSWLSCSCYCMAIALLAKVQRLLFCLHQLALVINCFWQQHVCW